jgi:protein SCO1/2
MARKPRHRAAAEHRLRRGRRVLVASLVGFAVLAAGVIAYEEITRPQAPAATASTIGGPFTLVDQDGHTVTNASYHDKWLLIYFGYTHCPDACPTALSDMAEALSGLGPRRAKLQALFITVDPERDTPAVMKDYTAAFDAGIVGLTGSVAQIAQAAKAFHVYYARDKSTGPDYGMAHSSVIYLMGPDGRFVTNFTGEATPEAMRAKILQSLS